MGCEAPEQAGTPTTKKEGDFKRNLKHVMNALCLLTDDQIRGEYRTTAMQAVAYAQEEQRKLNHMQAVKDAVATECARIAEQVKELKRDPNTVEIMEFFAGKNEIRVNKHRNEVLDEILELLSSS